VAKQKLRRRTKQYKKILCMLVILFVITQTLLMPLTDACADDNQNDSAMETESCDTGSEDSEEENPEEDLPDQSEEDLDEDLEEDPESGTDEDECENTSEEQYQKETAESLEENRQEEEQEEAGEEQAEEEVAQEENEQIAEEETPETDDITPPDDPEELDVEEGNGTEEDEEDDDANEEDTTEETGLPELTAESEDWFANLCSDSGLFFPAGSSLSVLPITKDEEETAETCQYLSELFSEEKPEEDLIGFYEFSWETPDSDFEDGDLFLSFTLNADEYTDKGGKAWYLEEEQFILSEDAEAEDGTFFLPAAKQGVYALTAEESEEKSLLPADEAVPEEKTEEDPEPTVFSAKVLSEPIVEETQGKKKEDDPPEGKSRRILSEEEEDADSSGPVRSSAAGTEVVARNVYRFHLSATDLAGTEVQHAEYAIQDDSGNIVHMLTLSEDNGWQADWEHIDKKTLSLTVVETGLYNSSGGNITEEWESSTDVSEREDNQERYGWDPRQNFDDGIYVIEYESDGNDYLVAVENPNEDSISVSNCEYWRLIPEHFTGERVSDAAIWNVKTIGTKLVIKNKACKQNGYLAARNLKNYQIYAAIDTEDELRSYYDNRYLKSSADAAGWRYLKATASEISCVEGNDNPTQFNIYRWVSFNDAIKETTVSFSHTGIPSVLNAAIKIKLQVTGNIGERDREFPFYVSVGGEETRTFSLSHQGEYVLDEILIGSSLTVSMEAPGYQIKAVFNDGAETEGESLTVSSVPADGGTIIFHADRNAELSTGIRTGSGAYTFVLMAVFLSLALQPLIKIRMQIQIQRIKQKTGRRKTKMKKTISMILLLLVCLSVSVPAWADGDGSEAGTGSEGSNTPTQTTPCFTVTYTGTPEGFTVPAGDVSFTAELIDYPTGASDKMITFGTQSINGNEITVPILLPETGYSVVGVYTYTITQAGGSILGVSYDIDSIVFNVIVGYINEEDEVIGIIASGVGKKLIINESEESSGKKTEFTNTYNNGHGTLTITNSVTGNIGDRQKEFLVTVTFTAPEGKSIGDLISYYNPGDNSNNTVSADAWRPLAGGTARTAVVTISLKNGQTSTFNNVPAGVGYEVSQTATNGYRTDYEYNTGTIGDDDTINATVINSMSGSLGTGIFVQRAPYIVVMAGGIGGLVLLLRGKRKRGF